MKIKILLAVLLCISLALCFISCSDEDTGTENSTSSEDTGAGFTFEETAGGYAVSGYTGTDSEISIPQSYEGKAVTSIGLYAFSDCCSLTSVTIPNSVTSIGPGAFYNCESLTSITIPNSVTIISEGTFLGCESLTSIAIPDSVTNLGAEAFGDCLSLTSATIPNSVTSIGEGAFRNCVGLTIYCEAESQPSGWNSSWKDSDNPVVWNCKNNDVANDGYVYIVIDGVRYALREWAEYYREATVARQPVTCEKANILASITYKGQEYGVTSIGDYAFNSCGNLTSVTVPSRVKQIGYETFKGCSSLTLYCEAESKPSGWSSLSIPIVWNYKNNDVADDGYVYAIVDGIRYALKGIWATVVHQPSKCEKANIPTIITYNSHTYVVTSIGLSAFGGCTSLTSVTIPSSVTSIGSYAFSGCTKLTSIEISNSMTVVDSYAFKGCSNLTIYCEMKSEPSGWSDYWNSSGCPVVWNNRTTK